ncbi:hypothetical protein [Aquisphaera insulae]|uniref:hypothetical protein n=1 Tax=Aquisphaera insulae TaxID=2712864 RepID=UPI0013E9E9AB|nr:hypothetical protein [Aquisphaera insulae]
MAPGSMDPIEVLTHRWRLREIAWARKLGRLRLGVEPLAEQLARYRGVTWALTLIPSVLAGFFLVLFTAFGRPDIGLIVVALLFLPIVAGAWLGDLRLNRRARAYLKELAAFQEERRRLGADRENATTP